MAHDSKREPLPIFAPVQERGPVGSISAEWEHASCSIRSGLCSGDVTFLILLFPLQEVYNTPNALCGCEELSEGPRLTHTEERRPDFTGISIPTISKSIGYYLRA